MESTVPKGFSMDREEESCVEASTMWDSNTQIPLPFNKVITYAGNCMWNHLPQCTEHISSLIS